MAALTRAPPIQPRMLCRVRSRTRDDKTRLGTSTAHIYCLHIVPFRRLHGCMSEQELNLLQLSSTVMTQLGAGAPLMPHAA